MQDQAAKLRELISQKKTKSNIIKASASEPQARVICVTSGKGGVGKTNFTLNLAIALSKQNHRVMILDADLGLSNVDIVLGIVPKYTLLDVINGSKELKEVITTGPNGIKFISGGSGILELIDMPEVKLHSLIEKLEEINKMADIILIDTGAGLSKSVMSFVMASDEVIIVATPEPTSITDAYAMIKTIGMKERGKRMKLLINRVESINEGKITFEKLKMASEKFLNIQIEKLGYLSEDISVSRSVKLQNPFILQYPNSSVSKNLETIALKLTNESYTEGKLVTQGGFFNKIVSLFR